MVHEDPKGELRKDEKGRLYIYVTDEKAIQKTIEEPEEIEEVKEFISRRRKK
jgi:hypothetical protein